MAETKTEDVQVQVVLSMPLGMRQRIDREARRAGVSRAEQVRRYVAAAFESPTPGKGAAA